MSKSAPPPRRRRLEPEARRTELLETAGELALEYGLDALSAEALADAAGVSRRLVYTYFENRAELLTSLFDFERGRYLNAAVARIPRPASFDVWIRSWVAAFFDVMEARGAILPPLFQDRYASMVRSSAPPTGAFVTNLIAAKLRESYGTPGDTADVLGPYIFGISAHRCSRDRTGRTRTLIRRGLVLEGDRCACRCPGRQRLSTAILPRGRERSLPAFPPGEVEAGPAARGWRRPARRR